MSLSRLLVIGICSALMGSFPTACTDVQGLDDVLFECESNSQCASGYTCEMTSHGKFCLQGGQALPWDESDTVAQEGPDGLTLHDIVSTMLYLRASDPVFKREKERSIIVAIR